MAIHTITPDGELLLRDRLSPVPDDYSEVELTHDESVGLRIGTLLWDIDTQTVVENPNYADPETERTNRRILERQVLAAYQANKDFLGLASPTNAQVLAQVKALTRQNNGLIRLLLGRLEGTD